ncbi:MAG: phage portal protein [Ilumatobacteraceae bacterium]
MALANLFGRVEERQYGLSFNDYARLFEQFAFGGQRYVSPVVSPSELTALQGQRNPIVAAAIHARMLVFAEARFQWQPFRDSRPGALFGTTELSVLEQPWPSATTGDLLSRMLVDADLYGNSYWYRRELRGRSELVRLNPARVMVMTGTIDDTVTGEPYGQELIGYAVMDENGSELATFLPEEICHFKPLPDPMHPFRGRSWISTVLPDVTADDAFSEYKHSFMRNSATPNLVVSFDPQITKEAFETFVQRMDASHRGVDRAFKTLYLGGGADVKVVGANFDQLNLKSVQGAGETRIAAAAGVPASYLGISEGLAGSSLNSGNYVAARRRFADGTIRPLWRSAAAALQNVLELPDPTVRLWYDDRDVAFLQEDVLDTAEIRSKDAVTMRQLVDGGFDPQSVVDAVTTGDMTLLVHSGQLSVQLQPPSNGETV